jgi:hypothetical protein
MERRRLCTLLRELTQTDRVLLEWRIVDGWDYADIAFCLGISHPDLVNRMRQIRTNLRRKAKALESGETKFNLGCNGGHSRLIDRNGDVERSRLLGAHKISCT